MRDLVEENYNTIVKETNDFFKELNEKTQELDWSFYFLMISPYEFKLAVRKKGCEITKEVRFPFISDIDETRSYIQQELQSCIWSLNRKVSEPFTVFRRRENGDPIRSNYIIVLHGFKIYVFYITVVMGKEIYKVVPHPRNPDDGFHLRDQNLWLPPGEKTKELKSYPNTLEFPNAIRS